MVFLNVLSILCHKDKSDIVDHQFSTSWLLHKQQQWKQSWQYFQIYCYILKLHGKLTKANLYLQKVKYLTAQLTDEKAEKVQWQNSLVTGITKNIQPVLLKTSVYLEKKEWLCHLWNF